MVYITLKSIKSLKNEIDSFTRKTPGKTNHARSRLNRPKNESALTKPEAPEKRISFKKGIVLNCFYIIETFLASNPGL